MSNTERIPLQLPLRVDFGGGWLDVPRFSRPGAKIVNCAIEPLVSLDSWPYHLSGGLGGSGAWAILQGKNGAESEIELGVGWQDPAVIQAGGCCVWNSGPRPELFHQNDGRFLQGRMALFWTGAPHDTPGLADAPRDFDLIEAAGAKAAEAVMNSDLLLLASAVQLSYRAQLLEGMEPLSETIDCLAMKYCGGGWGGYALYLFANAPGRAAFLLHPETVEIEPYGKVCMK